jgi:hypothetical protein
MHTTLYHTLSPSGIQLISAVGSFHTDPFSIMVYGGMVHRKSSLVESD